MTWLRRLLDAILAAFAPSDDGYDLESDDGLPHGDPAAGEF